MNSKILAVAVLAIFIFSIASSAIAPVKAQPQISVRNPLTGDGDFVFSTSTTSVGFKFNVTLLVSGYGTPPVFAWQVKLNYNSDVINATRAWTGATLGRADYIFAGRSIVNPPPSIVPEVSVLVGDSLLGGNGETPPPDPANLGIIEFQIMSAPLEGGKITANLDIDNTDTYLLDDTLAEIPGISKTSGFYEFSSPPPAEKTISIAVDKPQVTVGSKVTISGAVTPVTAGASVTIFYRLSMPGESFATLTIVTTDVSGNYVFAWTPLSEGTFELKSGWNGVNSTVVSVTVLPKPVKSFDVTGPGGVPDGIVDIRDIALVATAFGARSDNPRYNAAYDFNNDNVVNIIDIVMVAKHFGAVV